MAPINDEDIDPALRSSFNDSDTDPSMQFFARRPQPDDDATSELGEHDDFRSHSPAFQDSPREDDDESQGIKAHDLVAFSKMILQRKKLSHKATADLNIYCEASSTAEYTFFIKSAVSNIYILTILIFMLQTEHIEERLALHYVLALENRDLLKELTKPEQWVISEDLKKSVSVYTKAFLLSPTVSAYKGNASEHVLKAMHSLNVSGLPAENEVVRVKELLSAIGCTLTSFRNTMKTKIALSTQDGNKLRNIGDLAHDLIRNTPVTATLQLYIRLAFLRFHVVTYKQAVDTWDEVDATLVKWRKEANSEKDLTESFHNVYVADKCKYGDPSTTTHDVTQPRDVPGWLKTMDSHSSKVQGVVANKKRKHGHHR